MTQPSPRQCISQLETQLPQCMLAERFSLRRRLQQARVWLDQNKPVDKVLAEVAVNMQASIARLESRRQNLPTPEFPGELPVNQRKDEIAVAIKNHQVVIVCGETGSGKTTQLPKICLELGAASAG